MALGTAFDEVLAAARAGAEWAVTALYRDLHPPLLAYLRAVEPTDAEDLASDVWLGIGRNLSAFEAVGSSTCVAAEGAARPTRRRTRRSSPSPGATTRKRRPSGRSGQTRSGGASSSCSLPIRPTSCCCASSVGSMFARSPTCWANGRAPCGSCSTGPCGAWPRRWPQGV